MEPKKKPIPSPIARATVSRPLVAAHVRRSLPTIAALLAATAAIACQKESHIEPDREVVAIVKYVPSAVPSTTVASTPAPPPPGMGALELAAEVPPPPPPKVRPPPPPPPPHKYPPMVKGGVKHVLPPPPKAPMLGGDVAAVSPI
jgi:hypothetical protein